jgi:hypothetical protein
LTERIVALVGLPETGKTTFLAAFWAAVREIPPTTRFAIRTWPQSPEYLQSIADHWFSGEPVGRTSADSINEVSLSLDSENGEVDMVLPDLSGETFKAAVVRRVIPTAVDDLLQQASGILLFINCATATPRLTLTDARPLLAMSDAAADSDAAHALPFAPEDLESEVLTAELLQIVFDRCDIGRSNALRVGVVLSAWDVVPEAAGITPVTWLRTNQSMVSSLVQAATDISSIRVFGVSAQGGDYNTALDVRNRKPTERPLVIDEAGKDTDITRPVAWVVGYAD